MAGESMEAKPTGRLLDRNSPPHIVTLVLVTSLATMSMNLFLASLPAMAAHFDTTVSIMQYAISGFLFLSGLVQIVVGPLSDRFGRRPVLLVAVLVFVIVSLIASFSPTIGVFMVCRILQTSIVTGMVLSRAIARDMVGVEQSASLIGYITMGMALVPMLAPPIGGFIQELYGWRANFLVLAAVSFVTLILVYLDLGETAPKQNGGFSEQISLFPALLRSRRFWGYSLTGAFCAGTFFGYLGGGPFVAVSVYDLKPSQFGLYFCFAPFGYFVGNGISGRYAVRIGRQQMILAGTVVTTAGMALALVLQLFGATHPIALFSLTVFIGLGNGIALPSANAGMLAVRPEIAGAASGLGGALITLGGGILAMTTGNLLVLGNPVTTLLLCVVASGSLAIIVACYTISIESNRR